MEVFIGGQLLNLLPEKAVWMPGSKSLIIADVHLDKAAHFRKNGLPIPDLEFEGSIRTLERLIQAFQPEQLVVLGDLIHVEAGQELSSFLMLTQNIASCKLVTGNHDKQLRNRFLGNHWEVEPTIQLGTIHLLHGDQPLPQSEGSISGHWHPGVKLKLEFQKHVFPAFVLRNQHQLILPAFGKFTGLNTHLVVPEDEVFIVNSGKVWPIKKRS